MGFTGFRSKYRACNFDTGVCQGLYEWQTCRNAEDYSKSIAMKFMHKRSESGSVSYKIVDKWNENLSFKIV
jgi:hypothetical protein